ncbi:MAG: OmpA family protein [Kofleriaceae bacterium]
MRCLAAVVIALVSSVSVARAGVEVGGVAGLHTFSEDSDLGVVTDGNGDPSPQATSLKNSTFFGLRFGAYFNPNLGVEVEAGAIPTEPRSILFDVWLVAARAQVIYQLRTEKPGNVLMPFALAGAGFIKIVDVGATENESIVEKGQQITPYLGIGAKYRTTGAWGVRVDARALYVTTVDGGLPIEVELLLAIYREWGRKVPAKPVELPPPPKDEDPDKDGIAGAADQCPNEAEDKDGFEDENGCPDPDNDKDGIADANDKCPLEAEDKDGFEDDNGCPDPDNDGDGVLDAADKCNDKPETRNGYQDDDGCPDEIPETLKQFTGAIQGINFKVNIADLAPGSTVILDKAVAVLQEFKDVKLEIQGHTDDVVLRAGGKFADNLALSQARADTVKAYFVSKGVDANRLFSKGFGDTTPVVDPKGLAGAPLNNARTKNRRVEFKLVSGEAAPAAAPPPAP